MLYSMFSIHLEIDDIESCSFPFYFVQQLYWSDLSDHRQEAMLVWFYGGV